MEQTLHSERLYEGRIVSLRQDTVMLPSGKTTRREIVEHAEVVAVVALDSQGNVLLVRQYRKPAESVLLEIPAGSVEQGEAPLSSAKRELEEETGFSAARWEPLTGFYTSPGFCTEFMHVYLATGLTPASSHPDDDENIEVELIPLPRAVEMIGSGEICDAKSIAGLLLAQQRI